ncbi:winged helix-turn-helix domain-containing protein [Vulcanisaeta distributa]|uniref:winged helix-turn-helix domain-containing protein n=1 Tax=Vulcanisaeta distributa TaxID=164451 RepID=UPI0006D0FD67|nr:winged helix-turn-helix domain-containing protein [Vulcanisaeta distributa]
MSVDFIEDLFSSRIRVRVLKALIKYKEVNITKLSRELGVNYKVIEYHIEALKRLGIAEEKRFGRIRIIRISEGDPRVLAIERFFTELEQAFANQADSRNRGSS